MIRTLSTGLGNTGFEPIPQFPDPDIPPRNENPVFELRPTMGGAVMMRRSAEQAVHAMAERFRSGADGTFLPGRDGDRLRVLVRPEFIDVEPETYLRNTIRGLDSLVPVTRGAVYRVTPDFSQARDVPRSNILNGLWGSVRSWYRRAPTALHGATKNDDHVLIEFGPLYAPREQRRFLDEKLQFVGSYERLQDSVKGSASTGSGVTPPQDDSPFPQPESQPVGPVPGPTTTASIVGLSLPVVAGGIAALGLGIYGLRTQ